MLPSRVTKETIDVPLDPAEVRRRIKDGMSHVRSLLFTPTWGVSGNFVGNMDDHRFEMRARLGYSNGYTRLLFGSIERHGDGSRVRLEFKDVRFVVVLMNVITAFMVISMLAYAGATFRYANQGGAVDWSTVWAGVAGPVVVLVIFAIVELIGRRLGRRDERRMRQHIRGLMKG